MAIKPPNWCQGAVPSLRGWESPDGELLVARKHKQSEIDEYNGIPVISTPKPSAPVVETVVEESKAELLTEAPIGNVSLSKMTKVQLEALANENNIEFSKRSTKAELIATIEEVLD